MLDAKTIEAIADEQVASGLDPEPSRRHCSRRASPESDGRFLLWGQRVGHISYELPVASYQMPAVS